MKKNNKTVISICILVWIVMLVACENSSTKSDNVVNNQSPDHNSDEEIHNSSKEDATETVANEEIDNNNLETNKTSDQLSKEQEDTPANDTTTNLKETYLNKLNDTNEKTGNMEVEDSSTYALKDVAHNQYEAWDDLLNEIYGVLEEQLSAEEMSQLREEQRDWITHRDETAKEASLEYEGGTMEQLEYVTVLANETKERCNELVEEYMN
ncbi:lysozyme inhibitor LprI family protein [Gracilibacillus suaedae]|uniref:lysozyme inhibitor LprI family protein n=1 Tax=Gracilibacillus suaedae TaxID=2820273 RepID=UPI001ABE921B|nr:lysozyme inhibitor LprI family protein [Gracilibacillus suaedae]